MTRSAWLRIAQDWSGPPIATDPPVSEKQQRAMYAAAEGKSNLGIPKKVGEEFVGAKDGGADGWRMMCAKWAG